MGLWPTQVAEKLPLVLLSVPNRGVIATEASEVEGPAVHLSVASNLNGSAALPFVIPSSFVRSKQRCHPDRSEVEGPAVHLSAASNLNGSAALPFVIPSAFVRSKQRCHPDRSVAKWRDLQFRGPLLEMFFVFKLRDVGYPSLPSKLRRFIARLPGERRASIKSIPMKTRLRLLIDG
jgi:hypothetical protein